MGGSAPYCGVAAFAPGVVVRRIPGPLDDERQESPVDRPKSRNDLESAMRRALDLAATAGVPLGPNPRVGAVILDAAGDVVGEGYHRGAGTAHAEVAALADAGDRAHGGTAVVTLEPCNHSGRTGPCSQALLDVGVAAVVFAQSDHSPVAAGGAKRLRAGGVDVRSGVLEAAARALNPAWSFAQDHGRPFVTWKVASTLDGRVAAADGTSRWITGPTARAEVHELRSVVDAVVVGTGTVLADDPQLTARDVADHPIAVQPLRVVVGHRRVPAGARVLDDSAPTMMVRHRDPTVLLEDLWQRNCHHVLLEGGPTVAASFWLAGCIDEVVAYIAPTLLGAGAPMIGDLCVTTLADARRLHATDVRRVGDDTRITLTRSTEV
jgi:diaminohydroxyphosphoribosylaminopyrimidine deaminase / 5-amino-6-(5-phosphoribosylamino)uracil reductase